MVRRAVLAAAYPLRRTKLARSSQMLREHLDNAERIGLRRYLNLENFTHRSTDGPLNPFARVYDTDDVRRDFRDFELVESYQRYLHAPPLPVHGRGDGSKLGWHLWVTLRARP